MRTTKTTEKCKKKTSIFIDAYTLLKYALMHRQVPAVLKLYVVLIPYICMYICSYAYIYIYIYIYMCVCVCVLLCTYPSLILTKIRRKAWISASCMHVSNLSTRKQLINPYQHHKKKGYEKQKASVSLERTNSISNYKFDRIMDLKPRDFINKPLFSNSRVATFVFDQRPRRDANRELVEKVN